MDPTTFPLREGLAVPIDLVLKHQEKLERCHGISIKTLATRGGISVFELLLLVPPAAGVSREHHLADVTDLTLTQAIHRLQSVLDAFHKDREAEAEAAMLAMMEAEAAAAESGAEAGAEVGAAG